MSREFIKRQVSFLLQIIFFTIIFFGIHIYILHYFTSDQKFFFPLWQMYVFQFTVTFLLYGYLNFTMEKNATQVFNFFMIGTFFKMGLSILFLLPLLLAEDIEKQPDIINFFVVYFLFLFFEVVSLVRMLKNAN